MKTWTIKVPPELDERVARLAKQKGASRSDVVREALDRYLQDPEAVKGSIVERAGKLVGSLHGGPRDLASNPRHLKGFGQ